MANYKSDQYTGATATPTSFASGRDLEARVRAMVATITLPAGVAANDTVDLFDLPAGVRVTDFVIGKTGTGNFSVALGTSTSASRFLAATALGTGDPAAVTGGSLDPAPLSAKTTVRATLTGSPAAGQVLTVVLRYLAP